MEVLYLRRIIVLVTVLAIAAYVGACSGGQPPNSIVAEIAEEAPAEAAYESKTNIIVKIEDLAGFWHAAPDFSAGLGAGYQFFDDGWLYYYYDGAGRQYEGRWEVSGDSLSKLTLFEEYLDNYGIDQPSTYDYDIEYIAADPATGNPALIIDDQKFWKMNKPDDIINGFPVYMNLDYNFGIKDYQSRNTIRYGDFDSEYGEHIIIYSDIDLYDFKISSITYDEEINFYFEDIVFSLDMLPTGYSVEYVTTTPEGIPFEAISFAVGDCMADKYYDPNCPDCYGTVYSYLLHYNGKDGSTCVYAGEVLGIENSLVDNTTAPPTAACLINNAELICDIDEYGWLRNILVKYQSSREPFMVCSYEESPGQLEISPEKDILAYLAPYDFESYRDIYLFNIAAKKTTVAQIMGIEEFFTPFKLKWLNNEYLLIIVGYSQGTVVRGGDIYYYHLPSGASGKIIGRKDLAVQVETMKIAGDYVEFGICSIFNNAMNYLRYSKKMPIDEIFDLIKNHKLFVFEDEPIDPFE
jgi:hypothetical protein